MVHSGSPPWWGPRRRTGSTGTVHSNPTPQLRPRHVRMGAMKKTLLILLAAIIAMLGLAALRAKMDADAEAQLWADATDSVV